MEKWSPGDVDGCDQQITKILEPFICIAESEEGCLEQG